MSRTCQRSLWKRFEECIILGSDGIWDNLLSEQTQSAVTHACKVLRETPDCKAAAEALLQQAAKVCTSDNSAIIVAALNVPDPARIRYIQLHPLAPV